MRPGARIQSAIELLAEIEDGQRPADRLIDGYFRRRRFAGSSDRAAIVGLVYASLRRRAELDWWLAQAGGAGAEGEAGARRRVLAALLHLERRSVADIESLFDGGRYAPRPLGPEERRLLAKLAEAGREAATMPEWVRGNYPEWLDQALRTRFGSELEEEMRALGERAPVDLRVNSLKAERGQVLERLRADGVAAEPCRLSPLGIRLAERVRITAHPVFAEGRAEIQDESAQLAALLVDARPGAQVVDLCAGAGGKTLALAAAMENSGQVYACDVSARRLGHMAPRLQRAGVRNVQTRRLEGASDPWYGTLEGKADKVLLDAPCSGSGVWRRNPEAKWRLTPHALAAHVETQQRLLDQARRLVRPGGRLVYATCSLFECENEERIADFLADHPGFRQLPIAGVWAETVGGVCPSPEPSLMLTPWRHGVDGFFVAVLQRLDG